MHVRKSTAAGVVFGTQLNYEPRSRPRVTKRKMIDPLNVSSVYELILRLLYVLVPEQARWSKKQNQIIYKLNTRAYDFFLFSICNHHRLYSPKSVSSK